MRPSAQHVDRQRFPLAHHHDPAHPGHGCVPGIGPNTRILDVSCGTGAQTLVLARHLPARFVAIDNHAPVVEELNRQARALGLADRIDARVGGMRQLDFAPGSFDVIWCEGAIFVIGFEATRVRGVLDPGVPFGRSTR
ncbi:MAG TPA: class I SAM-dependent methyltransferase [Vicinamibacterales bacterium]|nr:class I SAM-dependent methyltransferase [Vicinamibacterales bacterium]